MWDKIGGMEVHLSGRDNLRRLETASEHAYALEFLARTTYGFSCFFNMRATRHVTHPMYRNNMRPSSSRR